jgi:hypothetical protein
MTINPELMKKVIKIDDVASHLIPNLFVDKDTNIVFRHGRFEEMQMLIREHGVPDRTALLLRGIDRNGECVWELAW